MIDELGDFLRWGIAIDIDAVSDGGEAGADIGLTHEPIRIEVAFDIDGDALEIDLILLSIGPHNDGEATTQRCEQQLDGVGPVLVPPRACGSSIRTVCVPLTASHCVLSPVHCT